MPELLKPDICVIGAGAGGLSVAAAAAAFGASVVLVEKARMGGDCLNTGCVPSKSLIAAAGRARAIAQAASFGLAAQQPEVDFGKVRQHLRDVIAAIAPNDSRERFTGLGVRVIEGTARFKSRRVVTVGDEIEVRARRFVLATGSSPAVPPIPGLEAVPFLTNETVFDLADRPEHLVVIGAGPVGLELAQAFRRFGAAVTVLEAAQPLAHEDPECAAAVLDQLVREGIDLRQDVEVVRVEASEGKIAVVIRDGEISEGAQAEEVGSEHTIAATHLLIATGRRPGIEDVGLDRAGVKFNARGILVDETLKTSNKRVYAVGDVVGEAQFTHVANYHAGIVIRNVLFRQKAKVNVDVIPRVTFTDPELAHVGLTEVQARERRIAIRVLRWPYHENDRAQAERATAGHIKVVTDRRGTVLGATIAGASAGELITAWTLAVSQRLNVKAVAGIVVPYPTFSEIGKRAAITYFTPSLTSNWVRRIIGLLRRLG
jgi:pyruvate/2-oxoglutarate dehydrogenase complex dihydrolipoamide dehydrogenase (E3) component